MAEREQPSVINDGASALSEQPATTQESSAAVELARDDEVDSALGSDDLVSDTTSLASSILNHREQWGRTYHKYRGGENDYYGPNDERQNDALDIMHHMITLILDSKLLITPLHRKVYRRVLDVGTGTGIWAIDFADAYPGAEVYGVDLSPTQPTWIPPNCFFAVDDVEDEWTFKPNYFDLVHMRCLMGSIGDWPKLYRQAFDHMVPGGWIQHLDIDIRFQSDDGTVGPDHILAQYSDIFIQLGEKIGKTFNAPHNAPRLICEAGFTNVRNKWFKVPVRPWPKDKKQKEIGMYNYYWCLEGVDGWSLWFLSNVAGWKMEEIQVFVAKMKNAFKDRKIHAYFSIGVTWGQKPESSHVASDS